MKLPKYRECLCVLQEEEEEGWKMSPSNFLPTVVEGAKIYRGKWWKWGVQFSVNVPMFHCIFTLDKWTLFFSNAYTHWSFYEVYLPTYIVSVIYSTSMNISPIPHPSKQKKHRKTKGDKILYESGSLCGMDIASGILLKNPAWCEKLPAAKTQTDLAKPIERKQFLNYCYKIYTVDLTVRRLENLNHLLISLVIGIGLPFWPAQPVFWQLDRPSWIFHSDSSGVVLLGLTTHFIRHIYLVFYSSFFPYTVCANHLGLTGVSVPVSHHKPASYH